MYDFRWCADAFDAIGDGGGLLEIPDVIPIVEASRTMGSESILFYIMPNRRRNMKIYNSHIIARH